MDSRSAKTVRRVIVRQREFATFGQSFLVLALHQAMHRSHVTDALRASGRTALAANALNEATILSLVSSGMGVGWVLGTARWRCPETVIVLPVVDLNMPLSLALAWRRDNASPLLASFIGDVRRLPDVRAINTR